MISKNRIAELLLLFMGSKSCFFTVAQGQSSSASSNSQSNEPLLGFTGPQLELLSAMHIRNLKKPEALAQFNPLIGNKEMLTLGKELFHSKALSRRQDLSCTSCHSPDHAWARPKNFVHISQLNPDRDPIALGATPYFRFLTWTGARDSVFAQSLAVLFNPSEHNLDAELLTANFAANTAWLRAYKEARQQIAASVCAHRNTSQPKNSASFDFRLSRICDLSVVDFVGLALEAYLNEFSLGKTKLDQFIEALELRDKKLAEKILNSNETAGLKIFLDKGQCSRCHYGPLLSDLDFHSVGAPVREFVSKGTAPDTKALEEDERGRYLGAIELSNDPNNCKSRPAAQDLACPELDFLPTNRLYQIGQYRTPQLRNVALTAPYFHNGQVNTLEAVVRHYSRGIAYSAGDSEIFPLNLEESEIRALVAFLSTLRAPTLFEP